MIPVGPFQGRIAGDVKFEYLPNSGVPKWAATLAVDEPGWDSRAKTATVRTVWVRLEAIGWQAEDLWARGLERGDEVAVIGRLSQFTYGEGENKDVKTHVTPLMVTVTRQAARRAASPAAAPQQPPQQPAPQGGAANDPWATQPPQVDTSEPPF